MEKDKGGMVSEVLAICILSCSDKSLRLVQLVMNTHNHCHSASSGDGGDGGDGGDLTSQDHSLICFDE
eukprot:4366592-Ditylum_brightwellii.AAC.1